MGDQRLNRCERADAPIVYHTVVSSHMHAPQQPMPIANHRGHYDLGSPIGMLQGDRAIRRERTVHDVRRTMDNVRRTIHRQPKIRRGKKNSVFLSMGERSRRRSAAPILIGSSTAVLCYFPCCRAGPVFPPRRGIESPWVRGEEGARGPGERGRRRGARMENVGRCDVQPRVMSGSF